MSDAIFELEAVSYSHLGRFPALVNVGLSIRRGQKVTLMGANGSGKSTLLNLLDALIFPDRGSIRFMGRPLVEPLFDEGDFSADFRRKVGLVFQNPDVQLFCPTVREDILFGPLQLGMGLAEAILWSYLEIAIEALFLVSALAGIRIVSEISKAQSAWLQDLRAA